MSDPLPPLSALRAFEAAARLESLSAAGRELNVTHAAVAQQVRRLERWFETPLLHRAGRGVAPTEEGARLAIGLREGFAAIAAAVAQLSTLQAARPLRLTTTPSFASNWLIPRLGPFRAKHPEIELVIDPISQIVDMNTADRDIAIRYGRGEWPGVEARRLLASRMVIAAAPDLIEGREICEPRDLLDLPWVEEYGSDEWRLWLEAHGVTNARNSKVAHMPGNLAVDGIRRGVGVGMTARAWLETDIAEGRVVTLLDEETDPELGYYVVTRPGPQRPAAKAFLKWVFAAAG